MENLGHYLNFIKNWIKEFWKLLFEDTRKIQAHHLLAFLLTLLIIYFLSYIIAKLFKSIMMLCLIVSVVWLVWMLCFDQSKFQKLFSKETYQKTSKDSNSDPK